MKGFPDQNPQTMADVVRGFQKIATGGILDNVYLVPDVDGRKRYKLNASLATGRRSPLRRVRRRQRGRDDHRHPSGRHEARGPVAPRRLEEFRHQPAVRLLAARHEQGRRRRGGQFYLADRWLYQHTTSTAAVTVAQAVDARTESRRTASR
jgi:hypothetical protein